MIEEKFPPYKAEELNLHRTTTLLSIGNATVMGNIRPAYEVMNLYGQILVWGMFNVDRGKFKGTRLSNNAATEDVVYYAEEFF